jgi:hypothetical protein
MGTHFSGVVESVGAGVTRFRVGDEVLGTARLAAAGAFAEKLITIVFDCNGSLTPGHGDALVKRGGVVIDTNPTSSKFMRSLFSRRHKFVFGSPSTEKTAKDCQSRGQPGRRHRPHW